MPDGLNWLCDFTGSSKSHHENSISLIFLKSPHQVDMKNVVKPSKHFFGYFNTLETHSAQTYFITMLTTYLSPMTLIFKLCKMSELPKHYTALQC